MSVKFKESSGPLNDRDNSSFTESQAMIHRLVIRGKNLEKKIAERKSKSVQDKQKSEWDKFFCTRK